MADGRRAGSSGSRYLTRKKSKTAKPTQIVELSDSSSECNEDDVPTASSLKSTPLPGEQGTVECPVCLQACIHPARLPCGHVFCFLCLKGIAQQSRRCAMCRQEISPDYLDHPDLLEVKEPNTAKESEDEYQWFYEGRNGGWWKFEERLCQDLEEVTGLGVDKLETLICGSLYVIDLKALVQYKKDSPTRKRRIKRDLVSNVVVKGVAGIR